MSTPVSNNSKLNVKLGKKNKVLVNQGAKTLNSLADVDLTNKTDGSVLVYDANQGKFAATLLLQKQTVNGGNF